jgi:hypothetical protein
MSAKYSDAKRRSYRDISIEVDMKDFVPSKDVVKDLKDKQEEKLGFFKTILTNLFKK